MIELKITNSLLLILYYAYFYIAVILLLFGSVAVLLKKEGRLHLVDFLSSPLVLLVILFFILSPLDYLAIHRESHFQFFLVAGSMAVLFSALLNYRFLKRRSTWIIPIFTASESFGFYLFLANVLLKEMKCWFNPGVLIRFRSGFLLSPFALILYSLFFNVLIKVILDRGQCASSGGRKDKNGSR